MIKDINFTGIRVEARAKGINKYGDPGSGGRQTVSNPVLFEEGNWRLYGHIDDEYSTMAHKCPKWAKDGNWSHRDSNQTGSDEETEWRGY